MARNRYLITHHGSCWFQIRVPRSHQATLGQERIRVCLQTNDVSVARPLALRLASEWLLRFSEDPESAAPAAARVAVAPDTVVPLPSAANTILPAAAPGGAVETHPVRSSANEQNAHCADMHALFRYWRSLNTDRAPSTVKEFQSQARAFERVVNKAPAELVRTDIAAFRDHLLRAGDARATVTKKLSFINAMLQSAYDAGFLPANVARGMKVPRPTVEAVKRIAFPKESLVRIFTSKVYTGGFRPVGGGEDAIVWVPMLALASGARLEELCQLRLADVLHEEGLGWYLNIGDGEGQRVKTVSSRRFVPLHPDIVASGFIRYVQRQRAGGQEWLFPALEPDNDGRRGGNFGKVFARLLRHPDGCGISDRRLVFHSFRHTFKTLCREHGVAEEVHDGLTGHVGQTVGRDYGTVPLKTLFAAMCSLRFPVKFPHIA